MAPMPVLPTFRDQSVLTQAKLTPFSPPIPIAAIFTKDPDEVKDFQVDWATALGADVDTIVTGTANQYLRLSTAGGMAILWCAKAGEWEGIATGSTSFGNP